MGKTQLNSEQIKDLGINVVDLNATGTPSASTYLRGDGVWATVTALQPDLPLHLNAPNVNETITAGYSSFVNRFYKVASGTKLTIGLGAYFRVL